MENNDLISRSALIAKYDQMHIGHAGAARKLMVDAPAVDAVEVVRCKDCAYKAKDMNVCTNIVMRGDTLHIWIDPDAYFSYGERKVEPDPEEDDVCEACAITYSWERDSANVLGETNDADE